MQAPLDRTHGGIQRDIPIGGKSHKGRKSTNRYENKRVQPSLPQLQPSCPQANVAPLAFGPLALPSMVTPENGYLNMVNSLRTIEPPYNSSQNAFQPRTRHYGSSSTMAIFLTHFSRFLLIILLALYAASSPSFSQTINSSDAICDNTPHPEFCKSLFPRNNSTNITDLGRISLRLALSNARNSLNRLNSYFKSKNSSIRTTLYVLRDCRFLLGLNTHFLSDVLRAIESANRVPESAAGDAQSLLSAVMSNQQTCWDQLVTTPSASNISIQFSPSLSNGSLLYSVSLALFKLGWIAFPRKVIGGDLAVFGEEYVKVREAVVVNPDGTGNYRTVGAAVAAAPKNGEAGGGYYVIRVAAGIYEEYVEIGSSKKYVMMIGEGINKTIITGNRSVIDGWTTFGCATFGVTIGGSAKATFACGHKMVGVVKIAKFGCHQNDIKDIVSVEEESQGTPSSSTS
nr:probable pectinesterase/pectinesterase inhibitor 20 [Ipomoea batatas]